MTDLTQACANCVFWRASGERGGQASGRCQVRRFSQGAARQFALTQADFRCSEWVERIPPIQAAE